MGKTKKKRQSASARANPVGLGETGDSLEMNGEATEAEIIANIMGQLQSGNPEDKVCGCQSLGNLTSLEIIRGVIVDQKLVRVAGPLLLDPDQMVRLAAAGALRNLSATDPDTAEEIVKQDVMTPVLEFFNQLTSRQADTLTDQEYNILTEAVNLVWNLVEASPTAFSIFTGSNLLGFNLNLLDLDNKDNLVLGVLNLLSAACDQNTDTSNQVEKYSGRLEALLSSANSLIRIGAALLLVTVHESKILQNSIFPKLIQTVAEILSVDARKQICDLSSSAPVSEEQEMEVVGGQEEDAQFKVCEAVLKGQQTSLELLANLFSLEGEEEEEGEDWGDMDSEEEDIGDEEVLNGEEGMDATVHSVSAALVEAIVSLQLVNTVLEKANSLPTNVQDILTLSYKGRKLVKEFENLRIRSFLCLSNLVECLTPEDLGGAEKLFLTWNSLGAIVVETKDDKLLEAASSCMRSVTSTLCRTKEGQAVMNLTQNELEVIAQVGQDSQVTEVRMNMVNIIGDISVLLSKSLKESGSRDVFKVLVGWLVQAATKDIDLRVVAEALDKLFDAFSEDDTDAIFFQLNLLQKMRGIANSMKIKIAAQKRNFNNESLGIVNMAKLNLQRFIKYKEKRQKI